MMIAGCGVMLLSRAHAGCPEFERGVTVGTVESPIIVEASGLAASRAFPGVFWVHNDSGDLPRIYAMNESGEHLGIYSLAGASHFDYEDIALGFGPKLGSDYLYVGDIGDNGHVRPNIIIYRVPEPAVDASQSPVVVSLSDVEALTLTYPDGPRDAETLMVDVNGDLYVVSKDSTTFGQVYRARFPQSTSESTEMEFVATLPWGSAIGVNGATGGDIAADGSAVIIRRYSIFIPPATLWLRAPGTDLADVFRGAGCNLSLVFEKQGEAICFAPNGLSYYTTSEGSVQPITFFEAIVAPGPDLDGDGDVDFSDLLTLLAAWGECAPESDCPADLDASGGVGFADLLMLLSDWS